MIVLTWKLALQAAAIYVFFVDVALAQNIKAVATDLDSIYSNYVDPPSGSVEEDIFNYAKTRLVWKDNNKLLVEVVSTAADAESLLQLALEESNFEKTGCSKWSCSGYLPMEKYPDLISFGVVKFVHPSFPFANQAGSKISEALQSLRVDDVRTNIDSNLNGNGLSIGILSDSFDISTTAVTNYAQDIASGDLPAGVNILKEFSGNGIDEGRGMAQLIHDLIPGADISFYTAFEGNVDFANGIQALADDGCDVIVDDIGKCDPKTFASAFKLRCLTTLY